MPYKNRGEAKQPSSRRSSKIMSSALKSFLDSAKQTISGASTPAPGTPAENTPIDGLFLKVDPAIDGEDCDLDCDSCLVHYPRGFKIDEDDKLYGYVKGWSTHVLVATGKTDWVRDVADEKGSVMEAIDKKAEVKPSNGVSSALRIFSGNLLIAQSETYAFCVQHTYSSTLYQLRRAYNSPPPASFHHHRKRFSQERQLSYHRLHR